MKTRVVYVRRRRSRAFDIVIIVGGLVVLVAAAVLWQLLDTDVPGVTQGAVPQGHEALERGAPEPTTQDRRAASYRLSLERQFVIRSTKATGWGARKMVIDSPDCTAMHGVFAPPADLHKRAFDEIVCRDGHRTMWQITY